MYKHFFKQYGLRFFFGLVSIFGLSWALTRYFEGHAWVIDSFDDLFSYYGIMFTCVILAGVMIKGFNNRCVLYLGIIATILEQVIADFVMASIGNLHGAIFTIYGPGIATLVLFNYRVQIQFWLGNQLLRFEKTRKQGLYLIDKTEDTNLSGLITLLLKLCWLGYFFVGVYYHYFMLYFGIHPEGPFLYDFRLTDFEYTLHLVSPFYMLDPLFKLQTYTTLLLFFRCSITEVYVKDLAGSIPLRLEVFFKKNQAR